MTIMARRKTIRVLLCNRHNLFREGIKALFLKETVIRIVGEAATAAQALALLQQLRPDVVLLDPNTADSCGSEATRCMKALHPHVAVLVLSLSDDDGLIEACLAAGAAGYIRSADQPAQLRRAISSAYGASHAA